MDLEKEFKKIKAYIYKWYKKDQGEWFPDANSEGREKKNVDSYLLDILNDTKYEIQYFSLFFEKMSYWKIIQSQYALLYKEDKEKFYKEFAESTEYVYLRFVMDKKFNDLGMSLAGFTFALLYLSQWRDKSKELVESMIYSINNYDRSLDKQEKEGLIIYNGQDNIVSAWFMLDLYCLSYNKSYKKNNSNLPKLYTPYDEVLKEWNTTDMNRVDQLVYKLCEIHIMRTIKMKEDWYQEFDWNEKKLFPFEILVWLKMRKEQGLENPETYSHYFMNEPLAKAFPLDKPLPFPEIPHIELLKIEYPKLYIKYLDERKDG